MSQQKLPQHVHVEWAFLEESGGTLRIILKDPKSSKIFDVAEVGEVAHVDNVMSHWVYEQYPEVMHWEPITDTADCLGTGEIIELWFERKLSEYNEQQAKKAKEREQLVDKVCEQIKEDVSKGDMTAIVELLKYTSDYMLEQYLSEEL